MNRAVLQLREPDNGSDDPRRIERSTWVNLCIPYKPQGPTTITLSIDGWDRATVNLKPLGDGTGELEFWIDLNEKNPTVGSLGGFGSKAGSIQLPARLLLWNESFKFSMKVEPPTPIKPRHWMLIVGSLGLGIALVPLLMAWPSAQALAAAAVSLFSPILLFYGAPVVDRLRVKMGEMTIEHPALTVALMLGAWGAAALSSHRTRLVHNTTGAPVKLGEEHVLAPGAWAIAPKAAIDQLVTSSDPRRGKYSATPGPLVAIQCDAAAMPLSSKCNDSVGLQRAISRHCPASIECLEFRNTTGRKLSVWWQPPGATEMLEIGPVQQRQAVPSHGIHIFDERRLVSAVEVDKVECFEIFDGLPGPPGRRETFIVPCDEAQKVSWIAPDGVDVWGVETNSEGKSRRVRLNGQGTVPRGWTISALDAFGLSKPLGMHEGAQWRLWPIPDGLAVVGVAPNDPRLLAWKDAEPSPRIDCSEGPLSKCVEQAAIQLKTLPGGAPRSWQLRGPFFTTDCVGEAKIYPLILRGGGFSSVALPEVALQTGARLRFDIEKLKPLLDGRRGPIELEIVLCGDATGSVLSPWAGLLDSTKSKFVIRCTGPKVGIDGQSDCRIDLSGRCSCHQ